MTGRPTNKEAIGRRLKELPESYKKNWLLLNYKFKKNMGILDIIIVLLVISWLGGFSLHLAGGLIHFLLLIALIVFIIRLLGR